MKTSTVQLISILLFVFLLYNVTVGEEVVCWGDNTYRQARVVSRNDFIAISGGIWHSLALRPDGSLAAWGDNSEGQRNVPSGNDYISIAAGGFHNLALKQDRTIVGWGYKGGNQLLPDDNSSFEAISSGALHDVGLKTNGSLVAWGNNTYGQRNAPGGNDYISVVAGGYFNLALKSDGTLTAWGWNKFGQCNVPAGAFKNISAGGAHCLAIKTDGSLVAWGLNTDQQCNVPLGNNFIDVACGGHWSAALRADRSIVAWGANNVGQLNVPTGDHFISIACGAGHGLALIGQPGPPPTADADGPYTIYVGDTLTLDANGSTDADDDILTYVWDLDDNGSFETDAGIEPIFDVNYAYLQSLGLLVNHTYNIHLNVTDSQAQTDTADSTLTIVPKPALVVSVDIKPGSCPNPLNVISSGVLPVAVLGSEELDVTEIVPTSIQLAGIEAIRNDYEHVAAPLVDSNDCNCTTEGPDGFLDLTLKFQTQEIVDAIADVNDGDVLTLDLTGVLFGERPIQGADCVLIRGKHKPFNNADINKDGRVDMLDFAIITESWLQSSIPEN